MNFETDMSMQSSTTQQQVFGIVVPGGNVRTDFVPADASGTKFTMTLFQQRSRPDVTPDLVLFLLPGTSLPPNMGAVIYWQASSQTTATGFQVLGALTQNRPSGIYRTGWAQNESIQSLSNSSGGIINITIGISLEPLESISNLNLLEQSGVEDRTNTAKGIAMDLFNYLQSFDDTGSSSSRPGWMTVPNNIFDRWMQRFQNKSRLDPNFFMKNNGNS